MAIQKNKTPSSWRFHLKIRRQRLPRKLTQTRKEKFGQRKQIRRRWWWWCSLTATSKGSICLSPSIHLPSIMSQASIWRSTMIQVVIFLRQHRFNSMFENSESDYKLNKTKPYKYPVFNFPQIWRHTKRRNKDGLRFYTYKNWSKPIIIDSGLFKTFSHNSSTFRFSLPNVKSFVKNCIY